MLSPLDRGLRERVVRAERRRDDNRLDVVAGEHACSVCVRLSSRIAPRRLLQALGMTVCDRRKLELRRVGQIAREIRPPVAVPDERDLDHVGRSVMAERAPL
jgi:hypothetical protein